MTTAQPGSLLPTLLDLRPTDRWVVLVDETGSAFGGASASLCPGRVVVVCTHAGSLPEDSEHATDTMSAQRAPKQRQRIREIVKRFETVGRAEPGTVGLLGLQAGVTPPGRQSDWQALVNEALRWMLRLLPLRAGAETEVHVGIEERGEVKPTYDTTAMRDALALFLRESRPEVSEYVKVSVDIVNDNADGTRLGWADKAAWLWNADRISQSQAQAVETKRDHLARLGLLGRDLVELPSDDVLVLARMYDTPHAVTRGDLDRMVRLLDATNPSVQPVVLRGTSERLLGCATRDPSVRQRLEAHLVDHMGSSHRDVPLAMLQLEWLRRLRATAAETWDTNTLRFESAALAVLNHSGAFDLEATRGLALRAEALVDDEPALAAEAALRATVAFTNILDFERAREALQSICVKVDGKPSPHPRLPRRFEGAVWSQLGQLSGFQGSAAAAIGFFDRALDVLGQLRDEDRRRRELQQTTVYRTIAWMDALNPEDPKLRDEVLAVCATSPEALHQRRDVPSMYLLATYLRWAAALQATSPEAVGARASMLSCREGWAHGVQHPAALIATYRSLLALDAGETELAQEEATRAAARWDHAGPAVEYVRICCTLALACVGLLEAPRASTVRALERRVDADTWGDACARLLAAVTAPHAQGPDAARALLRQLLPFNFR